MKIYRNRYTDPYFNLASEEYLLLHESEPCFMLWQNEPSVIIGRNQNAYAEIDRTFAERHNIRVVRRLTGGGAVFHDVGNLNFTFLVQDDDYDVDRQLSVIRTACAEIGLVAEKSGRNDLLVNGHKFSGNAFYHSGGHSYHHGTLLIEADMDKLSRYLTPSKAKLEAKGVASVRSRVTNLKTMAPTLTCEQMAEHMKTAFAKVYGHIPQEIVLTDTDIKTIRAYADEFGSWQWLYGQKLTPK